MKNTRALRRLALVLALILALSVFVSAEKPPAQPRERLKAALLDGLAARQTLIELDADGLEEFTDGTLLVDLLRECAAESADGSRTEYDVLNIRMLDPDVEDGQLVIGIDYLTTAEQERSVADACRAIRAELKLDGLSDFEKVLALYEYVAGHFIYDGELKNFSAYDGLQTGKMVCQGYALLLRELLLQEDIPCRVVTGYAAGIAHGWNIVQLDGKWYSLDVTWDACKEAGGAITWDYFLRGGEKFDQHTRGTGYKDTAFSLAHPMAANDYPAARARARVTLNGAAFVSLMIRKGVPVQLSFDVEGRPGAVLRVTSSDPEVVSVAEDGTITALKTGRCKLTVRASSRDIIPATIPVTAVDLSGASAWALETVTDFYLAGFLPAAQCAAMQAPITRGELAELIYPMVTAAPRSALRQLGFSFDDTDESENGDVLEYLASIGLVNGFGNGSLQPDAAVTREQMAKILCRLAAMYGADMEPDAPERAFADRADIAQWAEGFCDRAYAAGLMQGVGGGKFAPKQPLTREQAICTLWRLTQQNAG